MSIDPRFPAATYGHDLKTGWPPGMLQDDDSKLSKALANTPGARRHATLAAELIALRASHERLVEALEVARPYLNEAASSYYDGTGGHGIRAEATKRLVQIDAAIDAARKENKE